MATQYWITCMILEKCSKIILSKIDKTQYKAIRIALELKRLTSICWREMCPLNSKFVVSWKELRHFHMKTLHNSIMANLKIPSILHVDHNLRSNLPHIFTSQSLSCFLFPLLTITEPATLPHFEFEKSRLKIDSITFYQYNISG